MRLRRHTEDAGGDALIEGLESLKPAQLALHNVECHRCAPQRAIDVAQTAVPVPSATASRRHPQRLHHLQPALADLMEVDLDLAVTGRR